MERLRLTGRLLVLSLAACGIGMATPQAAQTSSVSGWFLADFNGDRQADVATAQSAIRDSRGYAQEIRVDFGQAGGTSFAFRSRTARVELSAWDIDGDNDRDIVILEALSGRPIGVWLNDGRGAFTEGDLAKFQGSLRGDVPVFRARPTPKALFALTEQRGDALLTSIDSASQSTTRESLIASANRAPRGQRGFGLHPRAPPSHA